MTEPVIEIDHAIVLVDDLETAHDWMLTAHGLTSIPGGRHTGHGTGNRIVPLGATYIELMAVLDADEADSSDMGRWALNGTAREPRLAALCLRTADAGAMARRLGVPVVSMSRLRPDGSTLAWHLVGAEHMFAGTTPLFFIEWAGPAENHPGRVGADHRVAPTGRLRIGLSGDPVDLDRRLGDHELEIEVVPGPAGVAWLSVELADGWIQL